MAGGGPSRAERVAAFTIHRVDSTQASVAGCSAWPPSLLRRLLLMTLLFAGSASHAAPAADLPIWTQQRHHPAASADTVLLTGVGHGRAFRPEDATLLPQPLPVADARMLPLASSLLSRVDWRPFGRENRVRVQHDGDRSTVSCSAGQAPAGVVLSWPGFRLPRGMHGRLVLQIQGGRDFAWAMAPAGEDVNGPVYRIAGDAAATVNIPAEHWGPAGDRQLVLLCPSLPATLHVAAIRLEPDRPAIPVAAERPTGTWIWQLADWLDRPAALVEGLRRQRVSSAYLQFALDAGRLQEPDRVRQLIALLRAEGIAVHAVEGDAAMTSRAGLVHARDRARILRDFLDADLPDRADRATPAGFGGVGSMQYDIEPYLNPEFARDPSHQWQAWASSVDALSAQLGRPVEVVVPFWLFDSPGATEALASVIGAISRVVVMAYRTDPDEVEAMAEPWLHWGAQQGRPVAIALEAGALPDDVQRSYARAPEGEVTIRFNGPVAEVALYPGSIRPQAGGTAYRQVRETVLPATRLTFAGQPDALQAVRERLVRHLSGWSAFDGLVLHEVLSR